MTRKDYQLIADAMSKAHATELGDGPRGVFARRALYTATHRLADGLEAENPRFDRARFLKACGVES